MKKSILILIFILCLTSIFHTNKAFALNIRQYSNEEISKVDINSKEKIYQDTIICLFVPYMQKELETYNKKTCK
ncbi:hypothetical protein FDB15_16545 [Clostridium botulinum]|uniref:hypothetical protein n=1 Tax=unclassified Clostridium TaxID=2614128 RepID=UPI00068AF999|nr:MULTISPECIES: hypothetical protein [unclassified Clostridium]MBY6780436.1 hypothetical protein [Clostridium botulinum]MBY6853615.1 hypothetical protein [Clostridium botulinum]MBY7009188.1 hypothetical protein [Clostridium botulinum]NFF24595.1 hypothetical protein [Clostridium botulinum]NFF37361.1 hypothetical protein [Clostridium botulinum]